MVQVYVVALVVGVVALLGWIVARSVGVDHERTSIDPDARFGHPGRSVVAALVGFGMAGMSAEFSPFDVEWPIALVAAIAGGAALAWFARWVSRDVDLGTEAT